LRSFFGSVAVRKSNKPLSPIRTVWASQTEKRIYYSDRCNESDAQNRALILSKLLASYFDFGKIFWFIGGIGIA